jgi:hypothetical protein
MAWAVGALVTAVVVMVAAAIYAVFTAWAWNYIVPSLFGLREITLLEAYALNVLASCFVKSSLRCEHKK